MSAYLRPPRHCPGPPSRWQRGSSPRLLCSSPNRKATGTCFSERSNNPGLPDRAFTMPASRLYASITASENSGAQTETSIGSQTFERETPWLGSVYAREHTEVPLGRSNGVVAGHWPKGVQTAAAVSRNMSNNADGQLGTSAYRSPGGSTGCPSGEFPLEGIRGA
jgi:hypothetical protein